jgi:hypothetical protein
LLQRVHRVSSPSSSPSSRSSSTVPECWDSETKAMFCEFAQSSGTFQQLRNVAELKWKWSAV